MYDLIKEKHPNLPIFVLGHSMGSGIAICFTQKYENLLKALILSGTGTSVGEEVSGFLKFMAKFMSKIAPKLKIKTHLDPKSLSHDPEVIKAYILPFRFFIQKNEKCSIRHLGEKIIPNLENDFSEQSTEFKKIRDAINSSLNSPPGLKLKFQWGSEQLEFQSNNDIKNCFIYGHYAHAEEKNNQKRWYDLIHRNTNEGRDLFRFEAISIILQLTKFFLAISKLIKIILDKIINYDLEEGKKAVKENDLERGLRFYKKMLYISPKK